MNTQPMATSLQRRAQLCIVQPHGYVHALGFLDQARYLQHHLERLGVSASVSKNRLRFDAVNFVFGAHLGFDPSWARKYPCVFVNLEQLGEGGANLSPHYLRLLRDHVCIDYDAGNVRAYAAADQAVPLLGFGRAPHLEAETLPLEQRPIDLLFIGSMNARRAQLISRIEALGVSVASFDSAVYGPERDEFVRSAKAVLNLHFYESARFAQARASFVMSCGTPLVSEAQRQAAPAPYADSVLWFEPERLPSFFQGYFGSEQFFADARAGLARFAAHDPLPEIQALWRSVLARLEQNPVEPTLPTRLNADMERQGYRMGWLNADNNSLLQPDWTVDLYRPLVKPGEPSPWPIALQTVSVGLLELAERGAGTLLGNALLLLDSAGSLTFELCLPRNEVQPERWVVRQLQPYTEQFWRQGWLEWRFALEHLGWLNAHGQPCSLADAPERCRVVLQKRPCSLQERMLARSALADFGLGTALVG